MNVTVWMAGREAGGQRGMWVRGHVGIYKLGEGV